MRRFVGLVGLTLVLSSVVGVAPAAARPEQLPQLPGGVVNIAGARYAWADGLRFARHFATAPSLRVVLQVVRACPDARLYGFFSPSRGAGIVGIAPTSLRHCVSVKGGGPVTGGGPVDDGCLQAMRTPYPDPDGISGRDLNRKYVLIAATSELACRDLSTQVPGGIWTTTNTPYDGLDEGTVTVIKCQRDTGDGVWDFVASYSNRLPASKRGARWIPDEFVDTEFQLWDGVPSC